MVVQIVEFSNCGYKIRKHFAKESTKEIMEFWINGELSKSAKIWLSKSIFYVKNHPNLSQFFSLKNTNLGAHFLLLLLFFDKINCLNHFITKMMPSKFNSFLWVCWLLSQFYIQLVYRAPLFITLTIKMWVSIIRKHDL